MAIYVYKVYYVHSPKKRAYRPSTYILETQGEIDLMETKLQYIGLWGFSQATSGQHSQIAGIAVSGSNPKHDIVRKPLDYVIGNYKELLYYKELKKKILMNILWKL